MIQIENKHGKLVVEIAPGASRFLGQHIHGKTTVVQASQRVTNQPFVHGMVIAGLVTAFHHAFEDCTGVPYVVTIAQLLPLAYWPVFDNRSVVRVLVAKTLCPAHMKELDW